jgi:nuclear transport factor 2 (NTF2) superfamily protein
MSDKSQREKGYYWIKTSYNCWGTSSPEWILAQWYYQEDGCQVWLVPGFEAFEFDEKTIMEVGERVIKQ